MATRYKKPWKIVSFLPDTQEWKVLARFKSLENARDKIEGYWRRYPNGWIEIAEPQSD